MTWRPVTEQDGLNVYTRTPSTTTPVSTMRQLRAPKGLTIFAMERYVTYSRDSLGGGLHL